MSKIMSLLFASILVRGEDPGAGFWLILISLVAGAIISGTI